MIKYLLFEMFSNVSNNVFFIIKNFYITYDLKKYLNKQWYLTVNFDRTFELFLMNNNIDILKTTFYFWILFFGIFDSLALTFFSRCYPKELLLNFERKRIEIK